MNPEELVRKIINHHPNHRGLAVVVACTHSVVLQDTILQGVVNDLDKTCSVFHNLHYAVVRLLNVSRQYIIDTIEAVVKFFPKDDLQYKHFIFCFAGHGDTSGIHTHDGEINVQSEIMWPLLPKKCPHLRHIPKLFFIDACRGEFADQPVPRGGGRPSNQAVFSSVSGMANYLLVQSTLPLMKAFESRDVMGGYWTQAFVKELQKPSNCGRDIGYILIEVNRVVNTWFKGKKVIQQAISECTLLDHVFLLVGEGLVASSPQIAASQTFLIGNPLASNTQVHTPDITKDSRQDYVQKGPNTPKSRITTSPVTVPTSSLSATFSPVDESELVSTPPTTVLTPTSVATSTLSPIDELEQRVKESDGESAIQKIKYQPAKEKPGGYEVTLLVPGIGSVQGDVCRSKSKAKKSAASKALDILKQIGVTTQ